MKHIWRLWKYERGTVGLRVEAVAAVACRSQHGRHKPNQLCVYAVSQSIVVWLDISRSCYLLKGFTQKFISAGISQGSEKIPTSKSDCCRGVEVIGLKLEASFCGISTYTNVGYNTRAHKFCLSYFTWSIRLFAIDRCVKSWGLRQDSSCFSISRPKKFNVRPT